MNNKATSITPSAPTGHLPIKEEVAERPKGVLRALEPEDLPLLYTIENDPEMWDVGATATPYSRHALRHHIQAMGADITESGELRFVIEYKEQEKSANIPHGLPRSQSELFPQQEKSANIPHGLPRSQSELFPLQGRDGEARERPGEVAERPKGVGLIDLTRYDARALRAEVSIAVLREYREQGIGIEALRLLEEHCRRYLRLHQLYALVPEGNAASFSLFQSAGFTPIFDIPDWHFSNGKYIKATFFQKIL